MPLSKMNIKFQHSFFVTILVAIFLVTGNSFAQNKGVVKFQIENDNGYFEVLVNDTLLIKKYQDSLPEGNYSAQVWSYGYDIKDVDFKVKKDSVTLVYLKLDRSTAYQAYDQSYHNYRVKFHKSNTLPFSVSLGLVITSGAFMIRGYDLLKQIKIDITSYSQTPVPSEIELLKVAVAENNRKYNLARTSFYVSSGLAVLSIATTIYTSIKFKNNNAEPTYSKLSPFNDKVTLQFNGNGAAIIFKIG